MLLKEKSIGEGFIETSCLACLFESDQPIGIIVWHLLPDGESLRHFDALM
ncbi:hypothetical protein BCF53_108106 [Reinekea marinisedimentorum]|uniref:Uncharacterized protein n=1 Tax=Reinekea marinisedimentorum TaxID=230495 RepID=A0A4R3I4D4_9GAMM|nr:hypothetical protein BCF53_108106 [Reinekea marinisedimentorum]